MWKFDQSNKERGNDKRAYKLKIKAKRGEGVNENDERVVLQVGGDDGGGGEPVQWEKIPC